MITFAKPEAISDLKKSIIKDNVKKYFNRPSKLTPQEQNRLINEYFDESEKQLRKMRQEKEEDGIVKYTENEFRKTYGLTRIQKEKRKEVLLKALPSIYEKFSKYDIPCVEENYISFELEGKMYHYDESYLVMPAAIWIYDTLKKYGKLNIFDNMFEQISDQMTKEEYDECLSYAKTSIRSRNFPEYDETLEKIIFAIAEKNMHIEKFTNYDSKKDGPTRKMYDIMLKALPEDEIQKACDEYFRIKDYIIEKWMLAVEETTRYYRTIGENIDNGFNIANIDKDTYKIVEKFERRCSRVEINDIHALCFGLMHLYDIDNDAVWLYGSLDCMNTLLDERLYNTYYQGGKYLNDQEEEQTDVDETGLKTQDGTTNQIDEDATDNNEEDDEYEDYFNFDTESVLSEEYFKTDIFGRKKGVNIAEAVYNITNSVFPRTIDIPVEEIEKYLEKLKKKYSENEIEVIRAFLVCFWINKNNRLEKQEEMETEEEIEESQEIEETEEQDEIDFQAEYCKIKKENAFWKNENATVRKQLEEQKEKYSTLNEKYERNRRELADLQDYVFASDNATEEEKAKTISVSYPVRIDKKVISFGGKDAFNNEMKKRLPDVKFVGINIKAGVAELLRNMDEAWIQTRYIGHPLYNSIKEVADKNNIQVRYYISDGLERCSEQMVKELANVKV